MWSLLQGKHQRASSTTVQLKTELHCSHQETEKWQHPSPHLDYSQPSKHKEEERKTPHLPWWRQIDVLSQNHQGSHDSDSIKGPSQFVSYLRYMPSQPVWKPQGNSQSKYSCWITSLLRASIHIQNNVFFYWYAIKYMTMKYPTTLKGRVFF